MSSLELPLISVRHSFFDMKISFNTSILTLKSIPISKYDIPDEDYLQILDVLGENLSLTAIYFAF